MPADLLAEYRRRGAIRVEHIPGDAETVRRQLDARVAQNRPFLDGEGDPFTRYTVQPGDTLSKIALRFYGQAQLWTRIFEANRDILTDPARIEVGQVLKIPPPPAD